MRVVSLPTEPTHLVANLPYNISVPVLLHFLEHFPVADPRPRDGAGRGRAATGRGAGVEGLRRRRASRPPGTASGRRRASCLARCSGRCRTSTASSSPTTATSRRAPSAERVATFELVDAAFQQRRKMLRQSLSSVFGSSRRRPTRSRRRGSCRQPRRRADRRRLPGHRAIHRIALAARSLAA